MTEVTFSLTTEGNIDQISVSVDGTELDFGSSGSVQVSLSAATHDLGWDSIGTYPAKFVIKHTPASPQSTQRSYFQSDTRVDGSRDIKVS